MFWPTDKPGVRFYAFIPSEEGLIPADIMHYMLITGNFVNLRVLPEFLWESTDSCSQPGEQKSQVNFDLIYRQFLMHYDLIYPSSGIITPFSQGYLSKIRDYMIKLMSDDAWDQYRYMPSTRDLPKGKRKLFIEWLDIVAKKN